MSYRFAVITKVPEAELMWGNLATAIDIYQVVSWQDNGESVIRVPPALAITLRVPVFGTGEILVLDPSGREIGYPGRKPDKWLVEYEEFDDLDAAVARSREMFEASLRRGAARDEG